MTFPRLAALRTVARFRARCAALGADLPCDDAAQSAPASPLAAPLAVALPGRTASAANRFVVQPMEGWDGTEDGLPSDLTRRRWGNFGRSGAGLIWGGEAVAVRADGRANPHQLLLNEATASAIGSLRKLVLATAREAGHPEPVIGLQLTHSGRWARVPQVRVACPGPEADLSDGAGAPGRGPLGMPAPRVAFRHPLLDARVGVHDDTAVLSDDEVGILIGDFAAAARLAQEEGFDFVDIKHCHGYLLHEFLAARTRSGAYGGTRLGERTRLLHEIVGAVRTAAPRIGIAVRLSVFDAVPHRPAEVGAGGRLGPGVPVDYPAPYPFGFGVDVRQPTTIDWDEPLAVVGQLRAAGIRLLNVTAGSPYYVPHLQRPALFPPCDGYAPPEDPLVGVARLLDAARRVKVAAREMTVVSTGWTYLQEFIPHVAQACVREGWCDAVGLGRLVLSYPEMPADVLAGRPLDRKRLCRTFSDCTSAPRRGFVSGCYPLDPYYGNLRGYVRARR
ncbi:NADH:flavin oxidoreductase [Candidatus Binatia bacterium]|nr:NADH:flavin oxidoreductase [Candidatus Binatia bacterium]